MSRDTNRLVDMALERELAQSYGRYAQTIILDRAIPDVRDGLKPVQRRIVYAMFEAGNTPDKPYRKCAKTVGDVMGNYHPHGDQSIYDAMVRLAQPWKMRNPLVDGHGNFGSVDDDPPAAMRYTEARLSTIALELVRDLDKDTIDWRPNFDEKDLEPTVLPARYPNLLVNGTSGVSTGFATDIPPHHLGEVIDATIALIDDPEIDLDELMGFVRGPDFPTGGIVMGEDGLRDAYETGRGKVIVQSRWDLEKQKDGKTQIVVRELPYGVVKSKLVADLDNLRLDKVVNGLVDVRDESDREGLRVVIELSKAADVEGVLALLLRKSDLQVTYAFNMVAIHKNAPRELGLKEILVAYVEHQRNVVRRRCEHDLNNARVRDHVVRGLINAVDILDDVIACIRSSRNRPDARHNLVQRFLFSDVQADAILDLRLHRLTNLHILELQDEKNALASKILYLEAVLSDESQLMTLIRSELTEIRSRYAGERRTEIRATVKKYDVSVEAVIRPQDVVVGVSRGAYIKRSNMASFRASGECLADSGAKEGDFVQFLCRTNTTHKVLVFTRKGVCFVLGVHSLPEDKWGAPGTALVNVVPFDKDDRIVALLESDFVDTPVPEYITIVTEFGIVKRAELSEFHVSRTTGIIATGLQPTDSIVSVHREYGERDILLITAGGQCIRFYLGDVSVQGRAARGVRGIGLDDGDRVIGSVLLPHSDSVDDIAVSSHVVVVSTHGKAKRTKTSDFVRQMRAGKGVRIIKQLKRGPHILVASDVTNNENDTLLLFTESGRKLPIRAGQIPVTVRDGTVFTIIDVQEQVIAAVSDTAKASSGLAAGDPPNGAANLRCSETEPDLDNVPEQLPLV